MMEKPTSVYDGESLWFGDSHYVFMCGTVEQVDTALRKVKQLRDGTYKGPFRTPGRMSEELYRSVVDKLLDRRSALMNNGRTIRKAAPE